MLKATDYVEEIEKMGKEEQALKSQLEFLGSLSSIDVQELQGCENNLKCLQEKRKQAFSKVCKIENAEYKILIIEKYFNLKSWEAVSEILGYSDRWVRTALKSASLVELQKIISDSSL